MRTTRRSARRARGFTLIELVIAASLTLVLVFGAIYSAGESFSVVSEGDTRVHTHVRARRALDRLLKDCRYAAALDLTGDAATGWTLTVDSTSSLDPDILVYSWSPNTGTLTVSDGSLSPDIVLEGLQGFDISTLTVDPGSGPVISRIKIDWVLEMSAGDESGGTGSGQTLSLSGSSWVRINA